MVKVVALGDSITYGFPYTPNFSWVNLVNQELGVPMINRGANGDSTAGMLSRFNRDVINNLPSHVIIMGGTNDACARVEAAKVYENIRHMTEMALEHCITPIIGIPIPCNYSKDEYFLGLYREEIREYASFNTINVIDFYAAFIESKARLVDLKLYSDIFHPNHAGYRVMADIALTVLKSCLQLSGR